MATTLLEQDSVNHLVKLVEHSPIALPDCTDFALEAIRNLSFVDHEAFETVPEGFVDSLWKMALHQPVSCVLVSAILRIISNTVCTTLFSIWSVV